MLRQLMLEKYLIKDTVSLRWDDKITDNLIGYWFGISNNKTKKFKRCYLAPINGGDLANGQFTKLLDNRL
jgi:hypothetical protein